MRQFVTKLGIPLLLLSAMLASNANDDRITYTKDQKAIVFTGAEQKTVEMVSDVIENGFREEEYEGTCTREVPYTENVCRDVTRHRQECRTIPAHEDCRQVNDPICRTTYETECTDVPRQVCTDVRDTECTDVPRQSCRNVTRYRQECRNRPGRRVCRDVSAGQVCRNVTRRECTTVNDRGGRGGRTVCRNVTERVCRDGGTRRECTTVGGGRQCTQVPYTDRVCDTTYDRQCRDVWRNDCRTTYDNQCREVPRTQCTDNYRRVCTDVPARQECTQVPYTENICQDETRFRTEEYACTLTRKVPTTKKIGEIKGRMIIQPMTKALATPLNLNAILSGKNLGLQTTSPTSPLILSKEIKVNEEADFIEKTVSLELIEREVLTPVQEKITKVLYKNGSIRFDMGKIHKLEMLEFEMTIKDHRKVYYDGKVSTKRFSIWEQAGKSRVRVNFKDRKIPERIRRNKELRVIIKIKLSLPGTILDASEGSTPKEQVRSVLL